jgi:uncharacterized protein YqgC (DUF456 family)
LTIVLIILGFLFALVGLIGCIVPVIPGPPISFFALLILSYAKNWEPFSAMFLLIMAALTAVVTLLDYVLPTIGAKRYGASNWGVWGSIIGMLFGLFIFPPWGMLLGAIAGVLLGELLSGKKGKKILRAGWGVFIGNTMSVGLKLALSGAILFFYIKEMF